MLVPLYGFLRGDTIGVLILAHHDMFLGEVADKLRESASVRVDTSHWGSVCVRARGKSLDLETTVAAAGLSALDKLEVSPVLPS